MAQGDVIQFGNDLKRLVEGKDSPEVDIDATGVVNITRTWQCRREYDLILAPKPKDIDALGYNAKCVSTKIKNIGHMKAQITSVYQGYIYLPPPIYEFSNSRMDRPITMHPRFYNPSYFDPTPTTGCKDYETINPALPLSETNRRFKQFRTSGTAAEEAAARAVPPTGNLRFAGIESYIVGSAQWRKTSFSIQPDFDQTDVGKINAPEAGNYTGLPDQNNTGKKWLKMEKTCVNVLKGASMMWQISETWQYNDLGWMSEIYG